MKIDTLTSAPFAALIGKKLIVEAAESEVPLDVIGVNENQLAAGPNSQRTPFSVMLRGPESPCLANGHYHIKADNDEAWRLQGIYLNRIIPPGNSDGTGIFYQLVFG